MCSRVWFVTDRRIHQEYPQVQILRALKQRCAEEDVEFRSLLMDQIVLTISEGQLGLRVEQEVVTSYPQVAVVRVPTPWVQSDSDITVLRHLEKMGCRLVNRPQAILNCVNKFWTFQELAGHGVPLPDTFSYGGHENFRKMIDEAEPLGYPVVVKNTRGHRGKAVFLARDKHHLADLSHLIRHDAPYLFQEYVKESHGRDVRVVLVGGRVIGSMLRCSTDGRMQSNCSLGGVGMMCPLSEQGKQLAVQVSNILGMDVCGIDLLQLNDGSFVVCEANANVGFIAFDQACGMDVAGIVADHALSLLPSRLTRKMSLLSVVSSASETSSEPEVCPAVSSVLPEAVCNMSVGSTSSESDPELADTTPQPPSRQAGPSPVLPNLPDPAYNFNTLLANEIKLLTE
ncbi:beta-citrylglutamate synthase B-like [Oncorhynchus nerka]|uniref:N-acetylaspartylglutamate synthase n=6 Tax=Salmonidae TaxID=8015 RepID=A0A8C7HK43_ONCKI|nr:beta-citrylglutamate synthase B [Salmo salar]XP_020361837.1 beta-citrylglutamate synthase B [Oncorhynchus kisutch]XP_021471582.2 beta-citrylglutamate synthase B [Oncorhynchus mykiss]XP_024231248.1 beta-citrylglutamate synthase B [Oncorhynchus tshawytscha]XP_029520195.1 beta-citrylglutamate synthase B-like [Oncorhynchus nerka]XP_029575540.1 beta-citrylglutamate synthase B-like [Salmo trutta]XP_035596751.1 beta-citrylglutamate synthase B-like [Oncorhynchus keta]XP_041702067.1 beta-citrylglu|eukprot:XP_014001540.1 PREDICTED: beta-citrylglutamate synthase B-like [Salmo salar]